MGLFQVCPSSFRAFHFSCQCIHFANSLLIFPHCTKQFPVACDQPLCMKSPFRSRIQQRFGTRELLQVGEKHPGSPSCRLSSGTDSVLLQCGVWMVLFAQFRELAVSSVCCGSCSNKRIRCCLDEGHQQCQNLIPCAAGTRGAGDKPQFGWSWEDLKQSKAQPGRSSPFCSRE